MQLHIEVTAGCSFVVRLFEPKIFLAMSVLISL